MQRFGVPFLLKVIAAYFILLSFVGGPFAYGYRYPALSVLFVINVGVFVGLLKQKKWAFVLALIYLFYVTYQVLDQLIIFIISVGKGIFLSDLYSLLPLLTGILFLFMNIFSIVYLIRRLKVKNITY